MTFIKNKEDFKCQNCDSLIKGNGFTNHCSICLWSKHVDIDPGDRLSTCKGMMKPISVFKKGGNFTILHKCLKCGFERHNKVSENDNFDIILNISSEIK